MADGRRARRPTVQANSAARSFPRLWPPAWIGSPLGLSPWASRPADQKGFRAFVEDYLVEQGPPSRCRFTWTVGFETPPVARPDNPIKRTITRSLFRDTRRHFGVV